MKKLFGILALIAAILTTTGTSAQSGSDDAVSWLEEITVTADFFGGTELSFNPSAFHRGEPVGPVLITSGASP